ncbi:hypothetical protein NN561_012498 [Cricetulus griseus]
MATRQAPGWCETRATLPPSRLVGPQDSTCSPHSLSPDRAAESGLQAAGQVTERARLWVAGKKLWRLPMRMYQRWEKASAGCPVGPLRDHIRSLEEICPCRLVPRVSELGLAALSLLEESGSGDCSATADRQLLWVFLFLQTCSTDTKQRRVTNAQTPSIFPVMARLQRLGEGPGEG